MQEGRVSLFAYFGLTGTFAVDILRRFFFYWLALSAGIQMPMLWPDLIRAANACDIRAIFLGLEGDLSKTTIQK